MKTPVLVTGGTGFIGQQLLVELTRAGYPCLVLLRNPERFSTIATGVENKGGISALLRPLTGDLVKEDLGLNANDRHEAENAGLIIHLGALFGWGMAPSMARAVNADGAVRLAQMALHQHARMVMVSGFMLANQEHLQRVGIDLRHPEASHWNTVYRRAGGYEASKIEAHYRVIATMRAGRGELVIVNPGTVAGHSDSGAIPLTQPMAELVTNLAAGRLTALPGTPRDWLPLVSVDTLARIIHAAAQDDGLVGRELLALDPGTPNLAGMVQLMADAIGLRAPKRYVPKEILRILLAFPGMERHLHMSRESLHFIQETKFDVDETLGFTKRHGIFWPAIDDVIRKTATYVVSQSHK